jgi:hypothetical protein
MSHVLATVLVSLILPAVALAIILRMERARNKSQDELPGATADPNVAPEFQVSTPAQTTVASDAEEVSYRERAG